MTLRTAALIAGALGVVLLAVGLISQAIKPAAEASPSAALTTTVAVFPPQVLALAPAGTVTVSGEGTLVAHLARTVDADAWLASREVSADTEIADWETVTGFADWDHLAVTVDRPRVATTPSPSPSVSPSTSPSTNASPSPSASPSTSATPAPSASPSVTPTAGLASAGSQDTWRATEAANGTYSVDVSTLPAGLTLVVDSPSGVALTRAQITVSRVIDDAWITQLVWWGVGLTAVGLIALVLLFIDMRPVQSRGESWMAYRSGIGSGKREPRPGSRRARRQAGASMPVADLDQGEAAHVEEPVVDGPTRYDPDHDALPAAERDEEEGS